MLAIFQQLLSEANFGEKNDVSAQTYQNDGQNDCKVGLEIYFACLRNSAIFIAMLAPQANSNSLQVFSFNGFYR